MRWERPRAPSVRYLWEGKATDAVLEFLRTTRVGCVGLGRVPPEDRGEEESGEEVVWALGLDRGLKDQGFVQCDVTEYKAVVSVFLVFPDCFVGQPEVTPCGLDILGRGRGRVELEGNLLVAGIVQWLQGLGGLRACPFVPDNGESLCRIARRSNCCVWVVPTSARLLVWLPGLLRCFHVFVLLEG